MHLILWGAIGGHRGAPGALKRQNLRVLEGGLKNNENNEKKCLKIKTDILYIAQNLKHNIIRSFLGVWELIWQKNAKKS